MKSELHSLKEDAQSEMSQIKELGQQVDNLSSQIRLVEQELAEQELVEQELVEAEAKLKHARIGGA